MPVWGRSGPRTLAALLVAVVAGVSAAVWIGFVGWCVPNSMSEIFLFNMVRCVFNICINKRRPHVSGSQPFDGLRTQQLLLRSILHCS